jgi:hypothetical protein
MINNKLFIKKNNGLKTALYNKNNKLAKSKSLFRKLYNIKEGNFLFLSLAKVQQVKDLKTKYKQVKINKQHTIKERKIQQAIIKENRLYIEAEKRAA